MKKINRPKKFKKKGFPVLFFLFLLLIGIIIATGAIGWYFIYTGKSRIAIEEEKTRNYSIALAKTFALTAEADFAANRFSSLRAVFQQKMQKKIIDEAFFVLLNGKLVAHSNIKIEQDLKGFLSNDEFKYNLDYIHLNTKKNSKEVHFVDYYIDGTEAPFDKDEMFYIKKYFYKDIDKYYWLVTRGVFVKGKPVGTVAFIISRNEISQFIRTHISETIELLQYALIGALVLSFFIAFIVFLRYRSIQRKTLQFSKEHTGQAATLTIQQNLPLQNQKVSAQKSGAKDGPQNIQPSQKQGSSQKTTGQKSLQNNVTTEPRGFINIPKDDYITIELLGTIDDRDIEEALTKEKMRQNKKNDPGNEQLTIFDDMPKRNMVAESNIKDAIPIRKD